MFIRSMTIARLLTIFMALLSSPALAQSCFQTMSVVQDRILEPVNLDVILQDLTGRSCGSVETERSAIFVDNLSGISQDTFGSYEKWALARANTAAQLRELRERLQNARNEGASAETWNSLKVISINTIGAGITIAGCLGTPFTGVSAYLCVGGLAVTGVGAYDGLSSTDFQARAREIEQFIVRLEAVLEDQDALGASILDEAQQAYLSRFELLCRVVISECQ